MQKLYEWILQSWDALLLDVYMFFFFNISDIKKLGKIHQLCWKERLKISKMAKFECYLLKTNADIASQTREFLERLYVGGKFVPPYPTNIQTYVKFSSLV